MGEPVYYVEDGRAYTVRDGVSVWLTEEEAAAAAAEAQAIAAASPAQTAEAYWASSQAAATIALVPGWEYVGWPRRAGGRVIDTVLTYAISLITGVLFGAAAAILYHPLTGKDPGLFFARVKQASVFSPIDIVIGLGGSILFWGIAEAMHGSTPGKAMLGMTVRREDGGTCDVRGALLRSVAYLVDSLFWGLVAFAVMQGSPAKQRLGDKWGHTVVVRTKSLAPEQRRPAGKLALAIATSTLVYAVIVLAGLVVKM